MPKIVGIDLGTTFSAIAALDDFGQSRITANKDGAHITPSCIEFFKHEDRAEVGELARKNLGNPMLYAIGKFKRYMGEEITPSGEKDDDHWSTYDALNQIQKDLGKELSPTSLSALVLKKLKNDAEEVYGDKIAEAVVTIPASFSDDGRRATLAAARDAGLTVKNIINEPTAAALYFSQTEGGAAGKYAVYDLGGGTFDISIIEIDGPEIEVIATNGVLDLGGDDFDRALLGLVNDKYKAEFGEDPPKGAGSFGMVEAEDIKKALSNRNSHNAIVGGKALEITREDFEESISTYIAKAEMLCQASLDKSDLRGDDLAGVILAGGSTRIPKVRESIKDIFGQEPLKTTNPDEVVALGAALFASMKGDQSVLTELQRDAVGGIDVSERTAFSLGTFSLGRDELDGVWTNKNTVLIPSGEIIPCSVTETFYTVHENQTGVQCEVTESKEPQTDPRFVKVIWEGSLGPLPDGRPANQPVEVTFSYDDNGMIGVGFKDVESGIEVEDVIPRTEAEDSSSDDFDIDNFLLE
jgi:molecular chaperone DnaK